MGLFGLIGKGIKKVASTEKDRVSTNLGLKPGTRSLVPSGAAPGGRQPGLLTSLFASNQQKKKKQQSSTDLSGE